VLWAIALVWCCLNPIERNVSTALLTYYVTPPGYIPKTDFLALWFVAEGAVDTPRMFRYIEQYRLIPDVVEIAPDEFIDIYRFGTIWWPQLLVFAGSHSLICATPCSLITFPE